VDALGNPLRLILAVGQAPDVMQGPALFNSIETDAVVADKGYDSDGFVAAITETGAEAAIPPRSNRLRPREFDRERYKARNLVEDSSTGSNNFVASRHATTNSPTASTLSCIWLAPISGYCEHALGSIFFVPLKLGKSRGRARPIPLRTPLP
jgi:transposase